MARTAQEDGKGAAAPGAAKVVAIAPAAAKARPWRERLDGLGVYVRWAAVAAALLIAVSAIAMQAWSGRTIGRLEFASGPTALRTRALDLKHQGVGQWACKLGSSLDTEAKSAALFSVGDGVRVAMAGSTSLQIVGAEKIALKSGAVWLSVAKGGKGFKVETPFGLVQVTGTHFGVAVSEKETRVEVTEGSVAVSQARQQGNVIAGQVLQADSGGIMAAAPRQEGKNLPLWVGKVLAAEKLAHTGNYLPSIGKR